jgi:uncharacterized protein
VLDSNVIISGLIWPDSKPGLVLRQMRQRGDILLSLAAFAELRDVLRRTRFRRYIDEEDVDLFLGILARQVRWIEVNIEINVCRDPKDDTLLSLAVSGGASHLVTGDKDLLILDPFRGIRILTPHPFLELP